MTLYTVQCTIATIEIEDDVGCMYTVHYCTVATKGIGDEVVL